MPSFTKNIALQHAYHAMRFPEHPAFANADFIHNGFDPHRMDPVLSKQEARALLELPQQRRIVTYAGRINDKKGLDVILELADRMPEVLFVLVGSTGRGPIEIEAEAKDNVRVVPWQTSSSISPYLYASDVLTIPPSTIPLQQVGNTVLPLKLFLYLAADALAENKRRTSQG